MNLVFKDAPFCFYDVKFTAMIMNSTISASLLIILGLFSLTFSSTAAAGGVYQEPDDFINEVFDNNPPKAKALWLDKDLKKQIVNILDHKYKGLFNQKSSASDTDRYLQTYFVQEDLGSNVLTGYEPIAAAIPRDRYGRISLTPGSTYQVV